MINEMHVSWRMPLDAFRKSHEGRATLRNLHRLLQRDQAIYYPARADVFAAFRKTPFHKVRVVIIGQDPYPCRKNATGLAFSTPIGRDMAKSVAMIYCAIATDLGGKIPIYGDLNHWASQGVLLLNRVLTFSKDGKKNADADIDRGWEKFTQAVVTALAKDGRFIHFMLWGEYAKEIVLPTNYPGHLIHPAPHPSPIVVDFEEFRKCGHFSAVNDEIRDSGRAGEEEINWFPPLGDPNYG